MDQKYYAFEVNFGGVAITNHAQFGNRFDFAWGSPASYTSTTQQLAVGWRVSKYQPKKPSRRH